MPSYSSLNKIFSYATLFAPTDLIASQSGARRQIDDFSTNDTSALVKHPLSLTSINSRMDNYLELTNVIVF